MAYLEVIVSYLHLIHKLQGGGKTQSRKFLIISDLSIPVSTQLLTEWVHELSFKWQTVGQQVNVMPNNSDYV